MAGWEMIRSKSNRRWDINLVDKTKIYEVKNENNGQGTNWKRNDLLRELL